MLKPNIASSSPGSQERGIAGKKPDLRFGHILSLADQRHMTMADTRDQSHFVQEMAKSLSPQFDELKMRSSAVEERVSSVVRVVTEQGHAISDLSRQFANYYEQSIAHSRSLEGEIVSLRREMNEHSSKMNTLLEVIAHSLNDRQGARSARNDPPQDHS